MKAAQNKTARRVQALLGDRFQVLEFEQSTRSAVDAATAIGCKVKQIAKSLVFRSGKNEPLLIIVSGDNRVDEQKIHNILGEDVFRADADFVKASSGFSIGGVPPVGHRQPPRILLDQDLQQLEVIWAAGGTPNAVFRLSPGQLLDLTQGSYEDVAEEGSGN